MAIDEAQLKSLILDAIQNVLQTEAGKSEETPKATTPVADDTKPRLAGASVSATGPSDKMTITEVGNMTRGTSSKEVVIGISPNFYVHQFETIVNVPHATVLKEIAAGVEEEGLTYRFMRVLKTADVAFIAHEAAKMSGSGIGIGVIARGTSVIHQRDLAPLNNLELFPQAPLLDAETFRAMGKNAAKYAKGESPDPVPVRNDQMARPRYQSLAALMHNKETQLVDLHAMNKELRVEFR